MNMSYHMVLQRNLGPLHEQEIIFRADSLVPWGCIDFSSFLNKDETEPYIYLSLCLTAELYLLLKVVFLILFIC